MVSTLPVANSGGNKSANQLPQPHSQLEFDIYIVRGKTNSLKRKTPKWQVMLLWERDRYTQGVMHILIYFVYYNFYYFTVTVNTVT